MKKVVPVSGRSVSAVAGLMVGAMVGLTVSLASTTAEAEIPKSPGIWLSQQIEHKLPDLHKEQLAQELRRITGWTELKFGEDGRFLPGDVSAATGGAAIARQILLCAFGSGDVFIIEDHSGSPSVNFGQMDEGTHYEDVKLPCQLLIWRVRLDFDDFRQMQASPEVRESFNAGFTMLHELLHGLGYRDPKQPEEIGDCERVVNQARAELGLPLRDQYFAEPLRMTPNLFTVRLRFSGGTKMGSGSADRQARRRKHYVFFLLPADSKP